MKQVVLLCAVMALLVVVARAIYCLWIIGTGGGSELLAQVRLGELVLDVMQLHWYALGGALLGLSVFLVSCAPRAWRALREEPRVHDGNSRHSLNPDPNDLLKDSQHRAADGYLRRRRRKRERHRGG